MKPKKPGEEGRGFRMGGETGWGPGGWEAGIREEGEMGLRQVERKKQVEFNE